MLVLTADGSHTLFVPELNEHYHSVHGAVTESEHIFIENGFRVAANNKRVINILEVGFGTGLNALLSFIESESRKIRVYYYALEPFPLSPGLVNMLNYPGLLGSVDARRVYTELHQSGWNKPIEISPFFMIRKICSALQTFDSDGTAFDLVYFDAFSPKVQPELWEPGVFKKLSEMTKPGALILTYSSSGDVKRALTASGFSVSRLPGPGKKRHILRAVRNNS